MPRKNHKGRDRYQESSREKSRRKKSKHRKDLIDDPRPKRQYQDDKSYGFDYDF